MRVIKKGRHRGRLSRRLGKRKKFADASDNIISLAHRKQICETRLTLSIMHSDDLSIYHFNLLLQFMEATNNLGQYPCALLNLI